MDWTTLFTLSFSLFLLLDPIGNVPIYISVLRKVAPKRQKKIILRELLIALGVILLFAFVGEFFLKILRISSHTVLIAGGIILFIIALKMIFPPPPSSTIAEKGEPFIVPLAIPLVAGPSVLAAVIIYSHENPMSLLILALVLAWLVTTAILLSSSFLHRILGHHGIVACERLMGLILTLISVQMFLEGVKSFFS